MNNPLILSAAVLLLLCGCSAANSVMERYTSASSGTTRGDNDSNAVMSATAKSGYTNNKRLALVIGNSDYTHIKSLSNPEHDAEDMTRKLESLNFEVMYYSNLNKPKMDAIVPKFFDKAAAYDVVLFYYAGHGAQSKGDSYLIPVDIQDVRQEQLPYHALNVSEVLSFMSSSPDKTNIVILDACRDIPSRSGSRSLSSRGLAPIENSGSGTMVAYATKSGSTAADGSGRNGTYTEHLLNNLSKPGLSVEKMLKQVRNDVIRATNGTQEPWDYGALRGEDVCLAGCDKPEAVADKKQQEDAARIAREFKDYKRKVEKDLQDAKAEISNLKVLPKGLTKKEQKILDAKLAEAERNKKNLQEALQASNAKLAQMQAKLDEIPPPSNPAPQVIYTPTSRGSEIEFIPGF